jgi:beta-1,4-mannosyltransferase
VTERVTVLVLGDLGRSPRMLNHALALAESGFEVSLAGYNETPVEDAIAKHAKIHIFPIRGGSRAPEGASQARFVLASLRRGALLIIQLARLLAWPTPRANAILVQNPPTLPTLPIAWLAARFRGARLLVDWHNFGYSMLALRFGRRHYAVRLAKAIERFFGRRADVHFCVSRAMREVLQDEFGISSAGVLYDRPRTIRLGLPLADRQAAANQLLSRYDVKVAPEAALVVCPTSWTADEDMDLLLDGLAQWHGPPLVVLITGRGPRRARFEERLRKIALRDAQIRTLFVDPADYPELLRAANVGISMHRSSSRVDLPMKVVDLFGARTPVCALDYAPCLREQIEPGRTGLLFRSAGELAEKIRALLRPDVFESMQRAIEDSSNVTWQQEWQRVASPQFRDSSVVPVIHRVEP